MVALINKSVLLKAYIWGFDCGHQNTDEIRFLYFVLRITLQWSIPSTDKHKATIGPDSNTRIIRKNKAMKEETWNLLILYPEMSRGVFWAQWKMKRQSLTLPLECL